MTMTIAELLAEIAAIRGLQKKVEALRNIKNKTLLRILRFTYVPEIEFILPEGRPPFKPFEDVGAEGALSAEFRRLAIFVKGNPQYTNLPRHKAEHVFINILEGVDKKDAEVLIQMISKKPFKGITRSAVKRAFPDWFVEGSVNA